MSSIPLSGIADTYPLPSVFVQINFATGAVSGASNPLNALIVANTLTTGPYAGSFNGVDGYILGPTTAIQLQSEAQAISLFGAGSETHRMYRQFIKRNPLTPLFACPVKESTGAQASFTITFSVANVNPALPGAIRVFTPEGPVDTGFSSTDTSTTIASNMLTNLNAVTNNPYYVSASGAGSVTITAKQKGLRGNWLRVGAVVIGSGTGVTITTPATGFMSFLSGGTVADSNANVISFLEGKTQNFYYIMSAAEDVTQYPAMATMLSTQAQPSVGNRQRSFAGSVDTVSNVISVSTACNQPRSEIVCLTHADIPPSDLAAVMGAVASFQEASLGAVFTVNFNGFGGTPATSALWNVPAPLDGTVISTSGQVSLLNSGVSPIEVVQGGNTVLVRRVTTYFFQTIGGTTYNDYRCRDASQVTISDFFANDVQASAALTFNGLTIANDPAPGQTPSAGSQATPRQFKSLIIGFINSYGARGLLQNTASIISTLNVLRETSPSTRLSAQIQLQPAEILNQVALVVNQATPSQ